MFLSLTIVMVKFEVKRRTVSWRQSWAAFVISAQTLELLL